MDLGEEMAMIMKRNELKVDNTEDDATSKMFVIKIFAYLRRAAAAYVF